MNLRKKIFSCEKKISPTEQLIVPLLRETRSDQFIPPLIVKKSDKFDLRVEKNSLHKNPTHRTNETRQIFIHPLRTSCS